LGLEGGVLRGSQGRQLLAGTQVARQIIMKTTATVAM